MLSVGAVPAANVYVGAQLVDAVYLGAVQVWPDAPPPALYTELFDVASDGWTNFEIYGSIPYIHTTEDDRAGIDRYAAALGQQAYGGYLFPVNTDSSFVEYTLAEPCFGQLSVASAVDEYNYVYLRGNDHARDGKSVRFTWTNGGKIEIGIDNGGSYTRKAAEDIPDLDVGDTVRVETHSDGLNRAINLTTGATLIEWIDTARELVYGDPNYRYAHQMQSTHTTIGVQYSSFACDTWVYGDIV